MSSATESNRPAAPPTPSGLTGSAGISVSRGPGLNAAEAMPNASATLPAHMTTRQRRGEQPPVGEDQWERDGGEVEPHVPDPGAQPRDRTANGRPGWST